MFGLQLDVYIPPSGMKYETDMCLELRRNKSLYIAILSVCYILSESFHKAQNHKLGIYHILVEWRLILVGQGSLDEGCEGLGSPTPHASVWVLAHLKHTSYILYNSI